MKGRWTVTRGEDYFVGANDGVFPNYPANADFYAVDNMQEVDLDYTYRNESYDFKFYYGHKELAKMGKHYIYPNPITRNNLAG